MPISANLVLIGYIPVVVAHRRHRTTWILTAYTALVAAAVVLLVNTVSALPNTVLFVRLAVAVAAVLFMVTAHKSEQKIMSPADRAGKGRIPLDDGDTQ